MKQPNYVKAMMYGMVMACIGMAIAITLAKMPPIPQPENTLRWGYSEHSIDQTHEQEKENGSLEVYYDQIDKPFYRAMYKRGSEYAYQLGVDMDQDHIIDFTVTDFDGDGYLDFNLIFCHENDEETIRRALLLFKGELKLEKTT